MTHYIGKKGYTILKSSLTQDVLNKTKSELNVIPFTGGDYGGEPEKPIKVYRENSTHLYIPKFFGINKYGDCEKNIPEGIDIDKYMLKSECKREQKQYKLSDDNKINFGDLLPSFMKGKSQCVTTDDFRRKSYQKRC